MANVYNAMPTDRFDAYTSAFYLLTLESMIASGELVGESDERLNQWRGQLADAKAKYEEVFWNETEGYYRYTLPQDGVDTVMLATLQPQYLAERAGLPDLVDAEHYQRHLASMYPLVAGANGPKLLGLPEGVDEYPLVGPQGLIYEPNVLPGAVFSAASSYVSAGQRFDDPGLVQSGLDICGEDDHSAVGDAGQRLRVQHAVHVRLGAAAQVDLSIVREQPLHLAAGRRPPQVGDDGDGRGIREEAQGDENELTITVTEVDGTGKATEFTAVHRIRNNASGTYEVGPIPCLRRYAGRLADPGVLHRDRRVMRA